MLTALQQVKLEDLDAANGWTHIDLTQPKCVVLSRFIITCLTVLNNSAKPLRTNLLQMVVLSNHQNGRDSRIRQVKIYGPRQSATSIMRVPDFESLTFTQYAIIK